MAEYDDHTGGGDLIDSTGFTFIANNDPESLVLSGSANESSENGVLVSVKLVGGTFATVLNPANWSLVNLPVGVTMGTITRLTLDSATIQLVGNRIKDYDSNITNLQLTIATAEYDDHTGGGSLVVNSGFTFTANNDPESLVLYGTANESAENGVLVSVKLVGGTFASALTQSNWTLSNLPQGVTQGTVTRVTLDSATIQLVGNRTKDYDSNITNLQLSITTAEYDDHTGGTSLVVNSGFTFIANNDPESLVLSGSANESSENGVLVSVKLVGGTFATILNPANWSLVNLPVGVTMGTISRVTLDSATIQLVGNRIKDYDSDITNLQLTITTSEYDDHTGGGSLVVNSGFTFIANNDPESLVLYGTANESAENGVLVKVKLLGGTLAPTLTQSNWILSNLPQGVTQGTVTRVTLDSATIQLVGDRTKDYDSNITNLTLQLKMAEYDDHTGGGDLIDSTGFTFIANNDPESLVLSGSANESSEDGVLVSVKLVGGTFATILNPANWSLVNLPVGVTMGTITRVTLDSATIQLVGNRIKDYDSNITNLQLTITTSEYDDHTGGGSLVVNSGFTFIANNDPESLVLYGTANESAENGVLIKVKILGGTFAQTLTQSNWILSNLPQGVTQGTVTRVTLDSATIQLVGDRTKDYDSNITNLTLRLKMAEYDDHTGGGDLIDSTGFTFIANNDPESLVLSGSANESSENGVLVSVKLVGGTFATVLNPANWSLVNLPVGVTMGTITRVTLDSATIQLVGNRIKDYDSNITNLQLTITTSEYDDHTGGGSLVVNSGFTFIANNDPESLVLYGTANESAENGVLVSVKLVGGTFASALTQSNWTLSNLPQGVIQGTVTRVTLDSATIQLVGNRTKDYDFNITNLTLQLKKAEYDDHTGGGNLIDSSGFTFIANNDSESLVLSGSAPESSEDGAIISVKIIGGTFATILHPSNWSLANLPVGVSMGTITRMTLDSATIQLVGDRTVDYDVDRNILLTITPAEYDDSRTNGNITGGGFTLIALNDQETIKVSWENPPGTNGLEATIGSDVLRVTLSGGTLFPAELTPANINFSGDAVLGAGLSIKAIQNISGDHFDIALAHNGRDYDVNKTLRVTMAMPAYAAANSAISDTITIVATFEPAVLSVTDDGGVIEAQQNGHLLHLALQQDTFMVASVDTNSIKLTGQPFGITIGSFNIIDRNHIDIVLNGDSYWDYDSPVTAKVTVYGSALMEHTTGSIFDNYVFSAINDTAPYQS